MESSLVLSVLIFMIAVAIAAYWLWLRAERVRRREVALLELEERLRRREITEREYTGLRWDLERRQDERNRGDDIRWMRLFRSPDGKNRLSSPLTVECNPLSCSPGPFHSRNE